jgi:hypothetical protein
MPHRKWDLRIKDILASIERIFEYTRNLDFEGFRSDTKTVVAVVRNFEIIGEAAAHLPEDLSADHYRISSEDFFHRFSSGQMEDAVEYVEWSNAYRYFLSLRGTIEKQVYHTA